MEVQLFLPLSRFGKVATTTITHALPNRAYIFDDDSPGQRHCDNRPTVLEYR